MRAVTFEKYGPPEVLQIVDLKKPKPKPHEVLIKVYATTAHIGDTRIRKADPFLVRLVFGLFKPRKNLVPGMEISGVIEAVGEEVTTFKPGDEVFALTGFGFGGYAEYRCLPEKPTKGKLEKLGFVASKPSNISHEAAAAIPAGCLTALKNLQKANIQADQEILINGASGSLGTFAIQLAKYFGAKVTAVCSGKNKKLAESIGADHVIDYTREDFTKGIKKYDIVYDAVMKSSAPACRKVLRSGGIFLNNSGLPKMEWSDILLLKELIENDQLRPIIDRKYSLDKAVEAHRYVEQGHKRGNVVLFVRKED